MKQTVVIESDGSSTLKGLVMEQRGDIEVETRMRVKEPNRPS